MTSRPAMPREEAFTFRCEGETLLGVLHRPADGARANAEVTGVVIIVGGPQYRAGSHRQFVHLARALAVAGHPVLRFDVRGMGDSSGSLHNFEQITPDVGAAIDALAHRAPTVRQVVLWGLCDGASAAMLYLYDRADPRVGGLSIANPWVRTERSHAQTRIKHYYRERLMSVDFWRKFISGRVGFGAARGLGRSLLSMQAREVSNATATMPYTARSARALCEFRGPVQLTLSGRDYTAREFEEHVQGDSTWRKALGASKLTREVLTDADHTFSTHSAKERVATCTVAWLNALSASKP